MYDRLTWQIKLTPFTLNECKEFFASRDIAMSDYDLMEAYMVFGGIPYYLNYVKRGKSLAQNIDALFFEKNAKLKQEFKRLFGSLFTSPEAYTAIVVLLAGRHSGYSRDEIAANLNIKGGGTLTKMLDALIASDFIRTYVPFGAKKRDVRYKLIDNFCQFAIRFVENESISDNQFWQHSQTTPAINAWRGIAFEQVCFSHTRQIKNALDVGGVISNESVWATGGDDEHHGAQIDMIISRNDRVTNLCEMKFVSGTFNVTADDERLLRNRVAALQEHLSPKQTIHLTLITTYGLEQGAHSGIFQNVVTAADIINSR